MGARRPFSEDAIRTLKAAMARTNDKTEYQRALCVWLPAVLGLDDLQVGAALGWPRGSVSRVRSEYRQRGEAALFRARAVPLAEAGPPEEGNAEKLRAAMKNARNVAELRRLQCVFMRVVLGFSSALVAQIFGWQPTSVSHLCSHYLRAGQAALQGPGRGGARRRILSGDKEAEVLRDLAQHAWPYGLLMFRVIHRAMEKAAGRRLSASSVQAILDRHGWSRDALVVTSRPTGASQWAPNPNALPQDA